MNNIIPYFTDNPDAGKELMRLRMLEVITTPELKAAIIGLSTNGHKFTVEEISLLLDGEIISKDEARNMIWISKK